MSDFAPPSLFALPTPTAMQALAGLGSWVCDSRTDTLLLSASAAVMLAVAKVGEGAAAALPEQHTQPTQPTYLSRAELHAKIHPLDRAEVEACWHAALSGQSYDIEFRLGNDSHTAVWIWEKVQAQVQTQAKQADGEPNTATALIFGVVQDVTQRRHAVARTLVQANHDPLTGLPNRTLLAEHLDMAIPLARRNGLGLAVLFIDLDRFKQVNDALGHAMGDELLRQVAQRMKGCLRESDMVARQGGDEFIVVLQEIGHESEAGLVALKLVEVLCQPFSLHGTPAFIGASIGLTLFPEDGSDAETLFCNADMAMYAAKASGRQTLRFYDKNMHAAAVAQHQMEVELRRALAEQQFLLHYQPIYEMSGQRPFAVEALIRWQHPERGLLAPDLFIPAAEWNGLIREIGHWVIEEACQQMAAWRAEGIDLVMSLNISARQIPDGLPLDWLSETLAHYDIDPSRLLFEITETMLVSDSPAVLRWVEKVNALGIQLALDDFGTGYASLGFLSKFQMQHLKIDQSFIRAMHEQPSHYALVKSIIDIGCNMGLTVTAEGVENADALQSLSTLGCHYAQGFHLAYPMSADAIHALFVSPPTA